MAKGTLESFEPVLLEPNGGTLHGFFLIRGEGIKLAELTHSPEWSQHQVRGSLHINNLAVWRGLTGTAVQERMRMWMESIPR